MSEQQSRLAWKLHVSGCAVLHLEGSCIMFSSADELADYLVEVASKVRKHQFTEPQEADDNE